MAAARLWLTEYRGAGIIEANTEGADYDEHCNVGGSDLVGILHGHSTAGDAVDTLVDSVN